MIHYRRILEVSAEPLSIYNQKSPPVILMGQI